MNTLDDQQLVELAASLVMNEGLKEQELPMVLVHVDHHEVYEQLRVQRIIERLNQDGIWLVDMEVESEPIVLEVIAPLELPDIILEDPKGNQPYFRRFEKGKFKGRR